MEEAQARTDDSVAFIRDAWTHDAVDWKSEFFEVEQLSLSPKPLQEPHPPIWIAAVSPSTYQRCGEAGERIITSPNFTPVEMIRDNVETYRQSLTANGFNVEDYDYPVVQQVYVGRDAERAYSEPRKASMAYSSCWAAFYPDEKPVPNNKNCPRATRSTRGCNKASRILITSSSLTKGCHLGTRDASSSESANSEIK